MEVAVIKDGQDKFCNHPNVILADDINALDIKIGKFLLDRIGDDDIARILTAQNAENEPEEPDPDDEAAYAAWEAAYEAWEDYEPSEEAIANFRETSDPSEVRELYQDHACYDRNPWDTWHIHTTRDEDAYSSVTIVGG